MKGLFIHDYVEGSWEPGVDLERIGLLQVHRLPALRQTCQGEGQVVPERTRPMGLAAAGGGGMHQSLRTGQEQGQLQVDSQFESVMDHCQVVLALGRAFLLCHSRKCPRAKS